VDISGADSGDCERCGGTDITSGVQSHPDSGGDLAAFSLIGDSLGNFAIAQSRAEEEVGVADVGIEEAEAKVVDVVEAIAGGATLVDALLDES